MGSTIGSERLPVADDSVKRGFRLLVSGGLLVALVWWVGQEGLLASIAGVRWKWVVAAWVLYVAGQIASAWKWRILGSAVGFHRPFPSYLSLYFTGMFFSAFALGTVGGDVVRSAGLARGSARKGVALNTVLADRAFGLVVLLALALVSLLVFRDFDLPWFVYWTVVLLSALLLAGWWAAPRLAGRVLRRGNRLRTLVEDDLGPYWDDRVLLTKVGLVSLTFHVSQVGVQMLLARSLGLEIDWRYFFIFGPLVNIFSAIPVSVNGLGVREAAYVFFLGHIELAPEHGVALGMLWFAVVLGGAVVGGVAWVAEKARHP